MNEIEKLKTEHARYREALERIRDTYRSSAGVVAAAALNPPPPVPVTVAQLTAALREFDSARNRRAHSIMFYKDESGGIELFNKRVFSFGSLQEAYNFLNQ